MSGWRVIGLGSPQGDDALGWRVIEQLQRESLPADVEHLCSQCQPLLGWRWKN